MIDARSRRRADLFDRTRASFPAKCEKGALDMRIALDGRGLIAGLAFTPHVVR